MSMHRCFTLILCLIFSFKLSYSSHFLGGTITWRPLNASATGSPVAIIIIQTTSWNYSSIKCTDANIKNGASIPNVSSLKNVTLACINNCGNGSIGYLNNITVIPACTGFSAPVGTTVGQRSDLVYLAANDDFSVAFAAGAWCSLTTVIGGNWSLAARINLVPRSDNGLYNNPPVATVMSPINIPYNKTLVMHIPVGDADGDTIRCRWSTNANGINECASVCPPDSLPPGTTIFPNCTIVIPGDNVTIEDWFAVAIMVEDFINSTTTTAFSSIPVQFLAQIVAPTACITLPDITGLPTEDSCTPIVVNQTYTSQLIAINYCGANVSIIDISTLAFTGLTLGNITKKSATTYSKSFSWKPTAAQVGYQVMCVMATDSQYLQSTQYCFKFYVSLTPVSSCAGETTTTTVTTSTTTTTESSTATTSTTNYNKRPNPTNWTLIGTIAALILLGLLTLCYCFCWHYICPIMLARNYATNDAKPTMYHIELCTDPDCQWPDNYKLSRISNSTNGDFGIKFRRLSSAATTVTGITSLASSIPSHIRVSRMFRSRNSIHSQTTQADRSNIITTRIRSRSMNTVNQSFNLKSLPSVHSRVRVRVSHVPRTTTSNSTRTSK